MSADEEILRVFPWRRKIPYRPVFGIPATDWAIRASWANGYHQGARILIEGVAEGRFSEGLEGVAGLFLFRHYLELELKYIIFHARWLEDRETIAQADDIKDVQRTHSLVRL